MIETIEPNTPQQLKPGERLVITTNHLISKKSHLHLADATQDDAILNISFDKGLVKIVSSGESPILRKHAQGHQPHFVTLKSEEFSRRERSYFIPYFHCTTDRPMFAEIVVEFEDHNLVSVTLLA